MKFFEFLMQSPINYAGVTLFISLIILLISNVVCNIFDIIFNHKDSDKNE